MYICLTCHSLFESPSKWDEIHVAERNMYETFYGCPNCGDGGWEDAKSCDICNEYINDTYYCTADNQIVCSDCCTKKELE